MSTTAAAVGATASVCAIEGSAGDTNQLSAAETNPQNPSVTTTCSCAGVSRTSSFPANSIASTLLFPVHYRAGNGMPRQASAAQSPFHFVPDVTNR